MNIKSLLPPGLYRIYRSLPGYIRRRRQIEDLEARLLGKLAAAEVPDETLATAEFVADLEKLNELIARHNRYYPIEANLPIELRTGRLLERGRPGRSLPALTAAERLARGARR
mgnify:CR=1 FL=1